MTFTIGTVLGLLGVAFCVASFLVKRMAHLRALAIVSNAFLIAYGLAEHMLPSLLLNAILLPLNFKRLWDIHHLTRQLAQDAQTVPVTEWLLPHMRKRRFKAGEVLMQKGERADSMIVIARGSVALPDIDGHCRTGELVGEIGLFSPERMRTQTVVAETAGEYYEMTDDMMYQLYFQNPRLGFHLVRLLAGRLIHDIERREAAGAAARADHPAFEMTS